MYAKMFLIYEEEERYLKQFFNGKSALPGVNQCLK